MNSATEVRIREVEHMLRVDKANQFGWLMTSIDDDGRANRLDTALRAIVAHLFRRHWRRSGAGSGAAEPTSAVETRAQRFA